MGSVVNFGRFMIVLLHHFSFFLCKIAGQL